jgi:hypothetical protein
VLQAAIALQAARGQDIQRRTVFQTHPAEGFCCRTPIVGRRRLVLEKPLQLFPGRGVAVDACRVNGELHDGFVLVPNGFMDQAAGKAIIDASGD